MQGRPSGHQIDPLAIIVGLEEQVNESAQRVDNAMRNLVELARAVRSLLGKVEELQQRIEDRLAAPPELIYGPAGEGHSETLLAIQTEQSALLQRIDDLEQRGSSAGGADYVREFQRTEADIEAVRIEQKLLLDKIGQLESGVGSSGEAATFLQELRKEVGEVARRQREQESAVREVQELAPKITQRLTDIARKYPEGSLAKVVDIERLAAAVDKLNKENAKVDERFKELSQLKDSSALLTILKTEHAAVLRRIENLEAAGPGTGEVPPVFFEVREKLDWLSAEHESLRDLLAQQPAQAAELPDIAEEIEAALAPIREQVTVLLRTSPEQSDFAPQIEAALAPIREQVGQLASGPQFQSEVTKQLEAALAPLRSRIDQVADRQQPVPDLAPVVEAAVAPLRDQLRALESRQPGQSPDTGKALEKLEATITGLGNDRDALLDQLAEQSKLIEQQKAAIGTLHDAFDGVKKAATESGKPSPELIEAAAAAKHLQGAVEKLTKEQSSLREQLKGVSALETKVADLEQREAPAPVDHSDELAALRESLKVVQSQQAKFGETLVKLESLELPKPTDYSQEFVNLRQEIGALNALQQPLLERIAELEGREPPEVLDLTGDLSGLQSAIEALRSQQEPLAARLAELETREIPEPTDHRDELTGINLALEAIRAQYDPFAARLAELEGRELPTSVDNTADVAELKGAINSLAGQLSPLADRLSALEGRELPAAAPDVSGEIAELKTTIEIMSEQQAPLLTRITALESREIPQTADYSADLSRIQAAVDKLAQESAQVDDKLSRFAEQGQVTKLMETLSELQMRLARNAEQLVSFEQNRNQGQEEQRKQLQNQLDIQERQRALLEEIQVRLEVQQEQIEGQKSQLGELVAEAKEAAEKRRRASDEPHKDPTMGTLIESALHIERGEYAEAVRCLEAARQLGDNPKIDQALALAKQMLGQQK